MMRAMTDEDRPVSTDGSWLSAGWWRIWTGGAVAGGAAAVLLTADYYTQTAIVIFGLAFFLGTVFVLIGATAEGIRLAERVKAEAAQSASDRAADTAEGRAAPSERP